MITKNIFFKKLIELLISIAIIKKKKAQEIKNNLVLNSLFFSISLFINKKKIKNLKKKKILINDQDINHFF